ncbi:MAG: hypothetical protein K9W45_03895 [Candidatus Heimdallarchaeum aukensis]|uniref:Uncharacterized protein n=1 Tax=Candidatus Heimdallarchaeum aukensis TaxID=2876573 RepID=A0A9Y1BMP5_9ARCH|nr:MAG: hypothetical protein K9W45_03895 [Candidatus Heimdallarchaeum aukensis]
MVDFGLIDLQEAMNEAETILGDKYTYFQSLITKYSVKPSKPFWDIIIFLTGLKVYKDTELFNKWINFWNKYSVSRKYKNLIYQPSASFSPFLTEEEAEKKFTKLLKMLYNRDSELTEDQLWTLFFSLFYKLRNAIKPKFSKVEFRVFLTILSEQTTILSTLNKSLMMAKSNLSAYIKRIREKKVIFEGFLLNLRKFNLSIFYSRIKYPLSCNEKITKIIPRGKFLRRVYEGHIACNYTFLSYLAPNLDEIKKEFLKNKKEILEVIPNAEIDFFRSDRNSRLYSFNYSNYDFKKGKWNFDIDDINYNLFWLNNTKNSKTDNLVKIIENFPSNEDYELKFDKETLDILRFFYLNPQKSVSQIIEEMDVRESKIRKAISDFEENQILRARVNPAPVFGLSNIILYIKEKKDKLRKIHEELSFFPEVYSEPLVNIETQEEELMIIVRAPEAITFQVVEALYQKYEKKIVGLFLIDQMYSTRQDLPLENFDTLFKRWKI